MCHANAGPIQYDAAVDPTIAAAKIKEASDVAGQANVCIFPDLNTGNNTYKVQPGSPYLPGHMPASSWPMSCPSNAMQNTMRQMVTSQKAVQEAVVLMKAVLALSAESVAQLHARALSASASCPGGFVPEHPCSS